MWRSVRLLSERSTTRLYGDGNTFFSKVFQHGTLNLLGGPLIKHRGQRWLVAHAAVLIREAYCRLTTEEGCMYFRFMRSPSRIQSWRLLECFMSHCWWKRMVWRLVNKHHGQSGARVMTCNIRPMEEHLAEIGLSMVVENLSGFICQTADKPLYLRCFFP